MVGVFLSIVHTTHKYSVGKWKSCWLLKQVVHILTTLLKRVHLLLVLALVVNYFRSVRGQSGGTQARRVLASRSVASLSPDRKVNKRNADVTYGFTVLWNGGALMSQCELHTSDSLPDDARRGPVSHYLIKTPTQFPNTTTHYNTLQHTTTPMCKQQTAVSGCTALT
jgi:hypothetical protein